MVEALKEVPLEAPGRPLGAAAAEFLRDGRARMKSVKCFDFVPSNYENAWRALSQLAGERFCEWGSGLGIVTGLAEMAGFVASGIEMDAELAEASRALLREHGLKAQILTGDFFELQVPADIVYVYGWPGQQARVEEHFCSHFAPDARLLVCYGQDDLRCMQQVRTQRELSK